MLKLIWVSADGRRNAWMSILQQELMRSGTIYTAGLRLMTACAMWMRRKKNHGSLAACFLFERAGVLSASTHLE